MKRSKPLKRGEGPKVNPAKVRAWQDRARQRAIEKSRDERRSPLRARPTTEAKPRAPLPRQSAKGAARARAAADAGREAKARDEQRCLGLDLIPGHVECWGDLDPQHVIPRGVRRDLAADPANIVPLCRGAHEWVGDHVDEAWLLGLHGYSWEQPEDAVRRRKALG